jgi:hypothetical protein
MDQSWVVGISGGSVERGNLTADREAVGHFGSPSGRAEASFFFWNYDDANNSFNTCNYVNPALVQIIKAARFAPNEAVYTGSLQKMVDIVSTGFTPTRISANSTRSNG